jgi:hypothetical protein
VVRHEVSQSDLVDAFAIAMGTLEEIEW